MKFTSAFPFMAAGLVLLGLNGCGHKANQTEVVGATPFRSPTEEAAARRGEHVVSTIRFPPGQTQLTPNAKTELQRSISEARALGEIENVTVAVWSDMEYPRDRKKLPKGQVSLAEKRGDKIENYLARDLDLSTYRVHVHNMGEKPTFLSQYFETADAELKQQLNAMGIAPASDEQIVNGRASSALIFIKLK